MRSRDLPRFHPSPAHQRRENGGHAVAVAVDLLCNQAISDAWYWPSDTNATQHCRNPVMMHN